MRNHLSLSSVCLVSFLLLKFVLQFFLIHPAFDLHRDEYLHLDQARHLAWGYESVPPFSSWISYIILQLGSHEWLVKFFPALFGALTLLIVWKLTDALKGGLFAKVLGALAITFSAILRVNLLYQPNSFDILSWTALYACLIAFVLYNRSRWLYFAGIVFALGFLNKYNIAFLIIGLIPALLLTPERKVFLNKHLYGAALIAFLLILPNLLWQYQHEFPVIAHMNELKKTQLVNVNRWDFLKEQLLFFISSVYILIAALISFFAYQPFAKLRFLFYAFFITMLVFVLLKAKSYYAIGLYPVFIPFGAAFLENLLKRKPLLYLRPIMTIVTLLLSIPILRLAFPIYSPTNMYGKQDMYKELGMLRWEDGKDHSLPQDFADMLGWKELARKVDEAQKSLGDYEHTLILCDNYGQAGAINHYTTGQPKAVSYNADYKNWFNFSRKYKHIIRVKEKENTDTIGTTTLLDFETITLAEVVTDTLAREHGTLIYIFKNSKANINDSLRKYLLEVDSF